MIGFQREPGLHESWLTGAVGSAALFDPVIAARIVCDWTEPELRALRDSLQAVFELWRSEKGTLPDGSHGGLLGNPYVGKTLAECPPYACAGERFFDYVDLLAKLRAEQYPPFKELEATAESLCNPAPALSDNIPRLPAADTQPGMQRILAALILSEAEAGNVESATKAHWELERIQAENGRRLKEAMQPVQDKVIELATFAVQFKKNSHKPRKPSPIRKAIARELKKDPTLKPRQLWEILASKAPKGWDFEGEGREARVWITGRNPMGYARFSAVCKEEKDKLAP